MRLSESSNLEFLDFIPDRLYQRLITHKYKSTHYNTGHSRLQQRINGILTIRQYLLSGYPITHEVLIPWMDRYFSEKLIQQLNSKILLKNTLDNESYTDDVLLRVLDWLDEPCSESNELSAHEKKPLLDTKLNQHAGTSKHFNTFDEANNIENIINNPNDEVSSLTDELNEDMLPAVIDIDYSMDELAKRFMIERHIGWGFSKGIENMTDKKALIQAHQLIKKSKKIRNIIQLIGRSKHSKFDLNNIAGLNNTDLINKGNAVPDEHVINSVTGVCYANDITRMLPLEMAYLSNKKLKSLWYSKFVEHKLLSYHFKGVMSEHSPSNSQMSVNPEIANDTALKTNGPIILCVDTSASMKGRPEQLAKAVALETMRIANREKRPCYLFCFSGPEEILELELDVTQGWQSIIEFLRLSFHGGTDINNVLQRALNLQAKHKWKCADILLVSDGRFFIADDTLSRASALQQLRFYGLQLGQWNLSAFNQICHQTFNLANA